MKLFNLKYISRKENLADSVTKPPTNNTLVNLENFFLQIQVDLECSSFSACA